MQATLSYLHTYTHTTEKILTIETTHIESHKIVAKHDIYNLQTKLCKRSL